MENPWKSIRTEQSFPVPASIREAVLRMHAAGHTAYIVGGCVRDFLLKRKVKDFDIATSATPDEVAALFPSVIPVGKAFGVMKVPIPGESAVFEIATFRKDLEYRDHRHPVKVEFSSAEEDSRRRDFTINAFYFDLKTQTIQNCVGGFEDLEAKLVRAIGSPSRRFREDALRLLRAIRFTTTLDFSLDETTSKGIRECASLVRKISQERIRDEISLMLLGRTPDRAIQLLADHTLLFAIFPDLEKLKGVPLYHDSPSSKDLWHRTLKVLRQLDLLQPRSLVVAWAALLGDVGRSLVYAGNDGKNFNGHEIEGAKIAERVCYRMRLSAEDSERVGALIGDLGKFKDVFRMRESTLQRWIRSPHFEDLLSLHWAEATATDGNLAPYDFCKSRYDEMKSQPATNFRLLDGNDLIQLGLAPGPGFSEILDAVEERAMEGELRTKEEALEFVLKKYSG